MRRTRTATTVLLATLVMLSATPGQGAHGDEEITPQCDDEVFFHLCVDVQTLGPGESITRHLLSPEGDLRAGWVYIIYGGVDGQGTIEAELRVENETMDRFVWTGGFHKNSTRIQKTGAHDLVLHNPSNDTETRYAFYYDQSCNCAGKLIPLSGGFVLFNYEFPADTDVTVRFPLVDGWGLQGAVATLADDATYARWPSDYQLIVQSEAEDKGWLTFDFHTQDARTYYVFLEETKGASPQSPIQLTPEIIIHEAQPAEAPAPVWWVSVMMLVGLAAWSRRHA